MDTPLYSAAYGFIVNEKKQFLLVRRAAHDSHPGMWELPGGSVEEGENLQQACFREVTEEAGVTIRIEKEIAQSNEVSRNGRRVVRHAFLCRLVDQTDQIQLSDEHDDFQWMEIGSQLPSHVSRLVKNIYANTERFI